MVTFLLVSLWVLTIASGFSFAMFLAFDSSHILTVMSGACTIGLAYVTSLFHTSMYTLQPHAREDVAKVQSWYMTYVNQWRYRNRITIACKDCSTPIHFNLSELRAAARPLHRQGRWLQLVVVCDDCQYKEYVVKRRFVQEEEKREANENAYLNHYDK